MAPGRRHPRPGSRSAAAAPANRLGSLDGVPDEHHEHVVGGRRVDALPNREPCGLVLVYDCRDELTRSTATRVRQDSGRASRA